MNHTASEQSPASPPSSAPPPSHPKPKGPPVLVVALVLLIIAGVFSLGVFVGPRFDPAARTRGASAASATHDHSTMAGMAAQPDAASPEQSAASGDMPGMPGMQVLPAESDVFQPIIPPGETHTDHDTFYTCSMHPWVLLPEDGSCPICQMDLTPIDVGESGSDLVIDPAYTQNLGVRIEPVILGPVVRTIRTVGVVAVDETRIFDVNLKVSGWIETVHVGSVGAPVDAGEPLFDLYSPQLYAAASQYLIARNAVLDSVRRSGSDSSDTDARRLLNDARRQLEFFDLTSSQIEALDRAGEPSRTVPILSPHVGVVLAKHANEGMRAEPGMRVYQIADLSHIWVMVSLYEHQLPFVEVGQNATVTLSYLPGQSLEGRVTYLYPTLDPQTRQAQVRIELDNPEGMLKPGMFATVTLERRHAERSPLVSRAAIIDTGRRQVAIVSLGNGRFQPRDVRVGVETDNGLVEVLSGLEPGELVVTSGQFLLDSEARLRENLAKMFRGDAGTPSSSRAPSSPAITPNPKPASSSPGTTPPRETSTPPPLLSDDVERALGDALTNYLAIGDLLAGDTIAGLLTPAQKITAAIGRLGAIEHPTSGRFDRSHPELHDIAHQAGLIARTMTLPAARDAYADLSAAFVTLLRATGVPSGMTITLEAVHCPMYQPSSGARADWIQLGGEVRNPYLGASMLHCFDTRAPLPVADRAGDAP